MSNKEIKDSTNAFDELGDVILLVDPLLVVAVTPPELLLATRLGSVSSDNGSKFNALLLLKITLSDRE